MLYPNPLLETVREDKARNYNCNAGKSSSVTFRVSVTLNMSQVLKVYMLHTPPSHYFKVSLLTSVCEHFSGGKTIQMHILG